jgi:ribosomal-protein-alanine N-acetyltransferase
MSHASKTSIHTARLALRELNFADAAFILELLNEAAFLHYIGDKGVRDLADAREYIAKGPMVSYADNGFGLYAACLHSGEPLGICGLVKRDGLVEPDVGFAFLARHWSKGYATESTLAVLNYGRNVLKLRRIVAITSPDNVHSIAVLEKTGFRFERMIHLAHTTSELKLFGCSPAETNQST